MYNAAHEINEELVVLKEEASDTYEALKYLEPLTQRPIESSKHGWKNAPQTSLDAASPIGEVFSQQLSHFPLD